MLHSNQAFNSNNVLKKMRTAIMNLNSSRNNLFYYIIENKCKQTSESHGVLPPSILY